MIARKFREAGFTIVSADCLRDRQGRFAGDAPATKLYHDKYLINLKQGQNEIEKDVDHVIALSKRSIHDPHLVALEEVSETILQGDRHGMFVWICH